MSKDNAQVKNFAIAGNSGAGKTMLSEALLFAAGAITRLGDVGEGQTVSDHDDDEKKRGISIKSSALICDWKDSKLFFMDTPGYADFFGDVIASIHVCDTALIVVDSVNGIDVGTQRAWGVAEAKGKARAFFISKLEKDNTDFSEIAESLRNEFGPSCIPLLVPVGKAADLEGVVNILSQDNIAKAPAGAKAAVDSAKESLVELAAESDDALLEKYLEEGELSDNEIMKGLKTGIAAGRIYPVFCGSAEKGIGITETLDLISDLFPSPRTRGAVKDEKGNEIKPDPSAPLSALLFKSIADPFVGHLSFFMVYSGTLKANSEMYNLKKQSKERIGHIYHIQGKEQISIESAAPGEIVAVAKMKVSTLNDTLCDGSSQTPIPGYEMPPTLTSLAVYPKSRGDGEKIANGLHKLCEEDPTLIVGRNAETKEMLLSGMGDLHIEIAVNKLREKYKVDAELKQPKIAYKETIRKQAEGHEKHKKQSGGRGQYGDVYLRISPVERGKGFEFVDEIVGGVIPKNFIPAVEKGIVGAMEEGTIAGYPVVDIQAALYFGSYHSVDSSELAFKIAGSKAFKDAMTKADPVLLEPIMNLEVHIPEQYMGDITGDLNSKRGRILGMETKGNLRIVKAQVPQAEIARYCSELRSITGGRGSFALEYSHYEEVPAQLTAKLVEAIKKEKEEES